MGRADFTVAVSFLNEVAMTTVYQSGVSGLYVLLSKCVRI